MKTSLFTRHVFLDQCRGYAIFGMVFVNVLGHFDCMPWTLKHHLTGFSYADSIAPLFIFVVGMGFRLSFLKTMRRDGLPFARKRAARRYGILMGLGLLFGGFHLRVAVWDALMDIGASGMLALPVMHRAASVRVLTACGYLGCYQLIYSYTGYGDWVLANSINGGPLGPLSWSFILLMGTAAFDCVDRTRQCRMICCYCCWAVVLSLLGWGLRMEWPAVKTHWPFTQFGMSAPYPFYASGLCFATVLAFYIVCERLGRRMPHLTTLGANPLVLYLTQATLVLMMQIIVPSTVSAATAIILFCMVYGVCFYVARYLERHGRFIKL